MQAYTLVAQARNQEGRLIGYLAVFCDGAFSASHGDIKISCAAITVPAITRQVVKKNMLCASDSASYLKRRFHPYRKQPSSSDNIPQKNNQHRSYSQD